MAPRRARKAPAGGDYVAALVGQSLQGLGLQLPEVRLSALREDLGIDRPSRAVMHRVGLDEAAAEVRRARRRPTVDFPAPMKPTRITFPGVAGHGWMILRGQTSTSGQLRRVGGVAGAARNEA